MFNFYYLLTTNFDMLPPTAGRLLRSSAKEILGLLRGRMEFVVDGNWTRLKVEAKMAAILSESEKFEKMDLLYA